MSLRVARFRISAEVLAQMLKLPEWCQIRSVVQSADDVIRDQYQIIVCGGKFKELPEGCAFPALSLVIDENEARFEPKEYLEP